MEASTTQDNYHMIFDLQSALLIQISRRYLNNSGRVIFTAAAAAMRRTNVFIITEDMLRLTQLSSRDYFISSRIRRVNSDL